MLSERAIQLFSTLDAGDFFLSCVGIIATRIEPDIRHIALLLIGMAVDGEGTMKCREQARPYLRLPIR